MKSVTPFLTFSGQASAAMHYYEEVIPTAKIERLEKFEQTDNFGDEDSVYVGVMTINGSEIDFLDMKKSDPAPEMNWSFSLMIICDTNEEFEQAFSGLSKNGTVIMGPMPIHEWKKATWVTDQFGVTWQILY